MMMKRYNQKIVYAISILILAVFLGLVFYNTKKEMFVSNCGTLTYYYSPGCGYCKEFSPIWTGDSSDSNSLQYAINNASPPVNVTLAIVDISDPANSSIVNTKKISGVPTIILTPNTGSDITFNDDRTPAKIVAFIQTNCSK